MMQSSLRRKSMVAYQLIKEGNWATIAQKLQHKWSAAIEPAIEAYQMGHDAIAHEYWSRHKDNYKVLDAGARPFSIDPVLRSNAKGKNIIWIMFDALRKDIFDEYLRRGGLRQLCGEGAYFSRTFAQGSWTYPSVFSFLTGRYPFNCGVSKLTYENGHLLSRCSDFDDSCPTIFSILRQQGYQVASILDGWGYTVRTTAGQEHREDHYFEQNWGWMYGQGQRYLSLPELRDASRSYLQQAAPQGPFMLFVRTLYTHSPYRGIFKSPEYVNELSFKRRSFRIIEGFLRALQQFENIYLKSLIDTLIETKQLDRTIIVISSDHGEMLWDLEDDLRSRTVDEEMWRHQLEPYNALIRVPLLIWGGHMQGVYSQRFRMMDVVPTLLDELGIDFTPTAFDGVSIRHTAPRPLYADSAGSGFGGLAFQNSGPKFLMSRRLGSVAYAISENQHERLETRHSSTDGFDEVMRFVRDTSRSPDTIVDEDMDEGREDALMRRLEALGYV